MTGFIRQDLTLTTLRSYRYVCYIVSRQDIATSLTPHIKKFSLAEVFAWTPKVSETKRIHCNLTQKRKSLINMHILIVSQQDMPHSVVTSFRMKFFWQKVHAFAPIGSEFFLICRFLSSLDFSKILHLSDFSKSPIWLVLRGNPSLMDFPKI